MSTKTNEQQQQKKKNLKIKFSNNQYKLSDFSSSVFMWVWISDNISGSIVSYPISFTSTSAEELKLKYIKQENNIPHI